MDSMKEFKSLFLERYLEKNKIGRKSLSRSITKSSSKLNKSNSLNKLSRSLSGSIKQPDDDDYEIYKFFDFLPQHQQQREKQSASNSNNTNSNLISNAIEINQRQRFSLPNNVTENYADTLDGTSELFIRNYNINNSNNQNSHLSESFNMLNSSDREIEHQNNSFQEEFYAIHVSKESTTSKDLSHLNSVNEENFLNFESLNLGSIHQDDNEFFFNQGKYLIKFSHTAKYFNFFIFFSKLRYFVVVMKKLNF
jgi:hypothetical protein